MIFKKFSVVQLFLILILLSQDLYAVQKKVDPLDPQSPSSQTDEEVDDEEMRIQLEKEAQADEDKQNIKEDLDQVR